MYNDYDDDYVEPEKNAEFREAIDSLIDEEIKSRDEETHLRLVGAEERAEKYSKLYYAIESEKRKTENNHKGELEAAIKEARISIFREFTGGYASGDTVYLRIGIRHFHKCDACLGSGKVVVQYQNTDVTASCPFCSYGNVDDPSTYEIKKGKICEAHASSYWDRDKGIVVRTDQRFWVEYGNNTKEFSLSDLFRTEEEAINNSHKEKP